MEAGDMDATTLRAGEMLSIAQRAVRFVPWSSTTWSALMLAQVSLSHIPSRALRSECEM